ncbi:major capsid protein [Mycobacterium phage Kimona]|uniref:Major capsid protein n=1 Tax=Mycobacterium phage Kimona TaxID=2024295 RepID=A0A249XU01_9CAUD|nr:major capsid protein [Mycobacterium phage Kimona]ASZ75448.1 major capsid protein [Mycobacterium phage Kimona]
MAAGTDFPVNHSQIAQTGDSIFQGALEPEQAQDYFAEAEKTSIVQRLARKIPMGPTGVKIPHWTGDVSAGWIGEGDMKPITKGALGVKQVEPHKIATIFIASAETVRANPYNYLGTMRQKIGTAIALAFDAAAIYGTDSPFDNYINETSKAVSLVDPDGTGTNTELTAYDAIGVTGLSLLVNNGKKWGGTLLDDVAEPILNGAKDANGRPLFVESTYDSLVTPYREGRILSRPTVLSDHVADLTATPGVLGFMGDFSQVVWGQVGGLSFDVSDQATLNLGTKAEPEFVSLWQHNLVAVRVEAEFGLLINDVEAFVRLTNEDATESAG